jgi:hypothetical protein
MPAPLSLSCGGWLGSSRLSLMAMSLVFVPAWSTPLEKIIFDLFDTLLFSQPSPFVLFFALAGWPNILHMYLQCVSHHGMLF